MNSLKSFITDVKCLDCGKFVILLLAILVFKLFDYSLVNNRYDFIDYRVVMPVVGLLLFFVKSLDFSGKWKWTFFIQLCIFVASWLLRGDSDCELYICAIVSLWFICNMKEYIYDMFVVITFLISIPFVLMYMRNILIYEMFIGNRGILILTVCGLLLNTVLYKYAYKELMYCSYGVLVFLSFLFGSRTSLMTNILSFALYVYYLVWGGTIAEKHKIYVRGLLLLGIVVVFFHEQLFNFLFNKWGETSSGTTVSSIVTESTREIMWQDALLYLNHWGQPADYVMTTYHYGNLHNGYLQAFVSYGIFGGIVNLLWLASGLLLIIKNYDNKKVQALSLFYIPMLLFTCFESAFVMEYVYPFIGLSVAIVFGQMALVTAQ